MFLSKFYPMCFTHCSVFFSTAEKICYLNLTLHYITFHDTTKALTLLQPVNACTLNRAQHISLPRLCATLVAWICVVPEKITQAGMSIANEHADTATSVSLDRMITVLAVVAACLVCNIRLVSASSWDVHNSLTTLHITFHVATVNRWHSFLCV